MIGSFEFNNINSTDYNLVCKSVNRPILPPLRPRMTEVYGKSGLIDYGGGDYATKQITMHIGYIGTDYNELRTRARNIAAWINTNQWAKLIINDETDKFYLARVIEGIDFETLNRVGETDITFECQPFAYMTADTGIDYTWDEADFSWETELMWLTSAPYTFTATGTEPFVFNNPGTKEINYKSPQGSKSQIIITGTWTSFEITLNGKSLEYTEAGTGTVTIDNIEMEVDLGGTNKLSVLDGDLDSFLTVLPGENTLTITGESLNVTVTIDIRPMWL
jgi:predicted phage tail component-like protein